jgi:metal-sulfur cluster biosynthetic enzyme
MVEKKDVINQLEKVMDPELMIDVWTLELIYDITIDENTVEILMTYTTPMCPYGPQLKEDVREHVTDLEGVNTVEIEVTFTPRWEPSDELRAMFGV